MLVRVTMLMMTTFAADTRRTTANSKTPPILVPKRVTYSRFLLADGSAAVSDDSSLAESAVSGVLILTSEALFRMAAAFFFLFV